VVKAWEGVGENVVFGYLLHVGSCSVSLVVQV